MVNYLVTGATGQLGKLIVAGLVDAGVPKSDIYAGARNPAKASQLKELGVQLRNLDYDDPSTLDAAFAGIDRVMLVSSYGFEAAHEHHRVLSAAAAKAGVQFLAYTSLIGAGESDGILARSQAISEGVVRASGVPEIAILRNAWYIENHTDNLAPALQHGTLIGAAQQGRISGASRKDLADGAVAVLRDPKPFVGKNTTLSGTQSYSLEELAAEVSKHAGEEVVYADLPEKELADKYAAFGFPRNLSDALADADVKARDGALESADDTLAKLLGRPAEDWRDYVKKAVDAWKQQEKQTAAA